MIPQKDVAEHVGERLLETPISGTNVANAWVDVRIALLGACKTVITLSSRAAGGVAGARLACRGACCAHAFHRVDPWCSCCSVPLRRFNVESSMHGREGL